MNEKNQYKDKKSFSFFKHFTKSFLLLVILLLLFTIGVFLGYKFYGKIY